MSYKDEVINQAIKSLEDAGFPGACSLSLMFDRVYQCGYNEAGRMHRDEIQYLKDRLEQAMTTIETLMKTPKVTPPEYPVVSTPTIGCKVCGIGGSNVTQTWGYVCPRNDCPTKVTCT